VKLQRREKFLVGASVVLVAALALYLLFIMGDSRSTDQLLADQAKFEGEIARKEKEISAAHEDQKRLSEWQRRSLPANPTVARELYQGWLRTVARETGLTQLQFTSQDTGTAARAGQLTRVSFKLVAHGKLPNLVNFMYKFYSAGYLHQIRTLDIKPPGAVASNTSGDLNVTFGIEALSLPTALAKTELPKVEPPKEPGHSLQLASLSDYSSVIATRNFFSPYVPAPIISATRDVVVRTNTGTRTPPALDLAPYVEVTAIVEVDGAPQVWIQHKAKENKSWKLGVGETFVVGAEKGTVRSINPEEGVVVEFRNASRLLHGGDSIVQGKKLDQAETPALTPARLFERGALDRVPAPPAGTQAQTAPGDGGGRRGGGGRDPNASVRGRRMAPVPDLPVLMPNSPGADPDEGDDSEEDGPDGGS
jgi:hypothetical protein